MRRANLERRVHQARIDAPASKQATRTGYGRAGSELMRPAPARKQCDTEFVPAHVDDTFDDMVVSGMAHRVHAGLGCGGDVG